MRVKDRLTAALIVIVGMALIRTNANPALWQIAFLSIGLYESILLFMWTARTVKKEHSRKKINTENEKINKMNAANLNEPWIGYWPMREVGGR